MYDLAAQECIPELFAISVHGPVVSYGLVTTVNGRWQFSKNLTYIYSLISRPLLLPSVVPEES